MSHSPAPSTSLARSVTLSPEALHILQAQDPGLTIIQHGVRKISNTCWTTPESVDSNVTVDIPEYLESRETFTFLEFSQEAGDRAWSRFLKWHSEGADGPIDFVDFATGEVCESHHIDAFAEEDNWVDVFQQLGVASSFVHRIMSPQWTSWRVSGSAKEWVRMNIEDRWLFLCGLDRIIRTPFKGVAQDTGTIDLQAQLTTARPVSEASNQPTIASQAIDPPANLDDHKIFHKGGSIVGLTALYNGDGHPNFLKKEILSAAPGDFSAISSGLCLTTQHQVAWQYAKWKAVVVDGCVVPVGILAVAVPNDLLQSHAEIYGPAWRDIVWANRVKVWPDSRFDYLADFQWNIGPVCGQSQEIITRLKNKDEIQTWKLAQNKCTTQWYTDKVSMLKLLSERCIGKAWITAVDMH